MVSASEKHDRVRALQRRKRLAQTPPRQKSLTRGIAFLRNYDDVEIAREPLMLKTVIEDDRPRGPSGLFCRFHPIGADEYRYIRKGAGDFARFVADILRRGQRRYRRAGFAKPAAVSARDNSGLGSLIKQPPRDRNHERRLAGTSDVNISNRYDAGLHMLGMRSGSKRQSGAIDVRKRNRGGSKHA